MKRLEELANEIEELRKLQRIANQGGLTQRAFEMTVAEYALG